ncbi:MAG: phosphoribosylamine--glycine ligase [Chloroflexi bacterium]|nr:phosphoribosylamine--glycine ligase [Chloroflexota bacterium]
MNVLVVGSGGREHALAWALRRSPRLGRLAVAPGNAGTAAIAENLPVGPTDVAGIVRAALEWGAELVVVGPDAALGAGVVDAVQAAGITAFGPTQAAAQIETSKRFAKEIMQTVGVPTARWRACDTLEAARAALAEFGAPVVVKADGLAAGKGAIVCETLEQAEQALEAMMVQRIFGDAGRQVVIEEKLSGREVSLLALVDGEHLTPLPPACDYKPVGEGNTGPNTGGMGGYTPPEFFSFYEASHTATTIMQPVVDELRRRGLPFRGVLYAGLMLTAAGPKVLEFNARFGDPEAQVILPCLDVDLLDLLHATATGGLAGIKLPPPTRAAVNVVLAAENYPGPPVTGDVIHGLDAVPPDVLVFHAGTQRVGDRILTAGGRVLHVVGVGSSVEQARERAYQGVEAITFRGRHYRRDIARGS